MGRTYRRSSASSDFSERRAQMIAEEQDMRDRAALRRDAGAFARSGRVPSRRGGFDAFSPRGAIFVSDSDA